MPCVIYARVSTREQEEQGYSIPYQLDRCRKKAASEGLTIAEEFVEAESASKQGRPGFSRMMRFLKQHPEVQTILCHKVDRLCRNLFDIIEVRKLGRQCLFVQEDYSQDASGELHFNLKVILAEHYSRNLSEEVKKGCQAKAELGLYPGPAPLGYRTQRGEDKKARLVPDERKAPILSWLFHTYALGTWTLRDLADEAAYRGLMTSRRKPLPSFSIQRILTNFVYCGKFRWKGLVYQGRHEPLVSEALFAKVQEVIRERGRTAAAARKNKHQFLLRGLLVCQTCGRHLTAENHPRGNYYRCHHPAVTCQRCPEPYIPVAGLDHQVEAWLQKLEPSDELKSQLRARWDQMVKTTKARRQKEEAPLRQALQQCEQKRLRLANALAEGVMAKDVYQKTNEEVEKRREHILVRLAGLPPEDPEAVRQELQKNLVYASSFWALYQRGSLIDRRKILATLVERIVVHDRQAVDIVLKKPFELLFSG